MIALLTVIGAAVLREGPTWHLEVLALSLFWRMSDLLLAALKLRRAQLELATTRLQLIQETR